MFQGTSSGMHFITAGQQRICFRSDQEFPLLNCIAPRLAHRDVRGVSQVLRPDLVRYFRLGAMCVPAQQAEKGEAEFCLNKANL